MEWLVYIMLFAIGLTAFYKSTFSPKDVLTCISLAFIWMMSPVAGLVLITLTFITYSCQFSKRKAWLGISLQLGVLILANYFLENILLFKLGLSYYGLQNIGVLLLSVRSKPQGFKFRDLLFGNAFFAKFISGPILLPKEIKALNPDQVLNSSNIYYGINRVLFGLFKKLVLADHLSTISNTVFEHPESDFKAITIIIACFVFTLEMYLNFSAYTDIALGIARLFNIKLKENFKLPIRSKSISEYWRKTHISLIDWFTQNFFYYFTFKWRKSPVKAAVFGIFITFLLSGIWHGKYIGFVIWGGLNALYLIIEYLGKRKNIKLPNFLGWTLTISLVSFANLFFKANYWGNSLHYLKQVFSTENWNFIWTSDVMAILGNGGYLEQQFRLLLLGSLTLLFFLFEKRLEFVSRLEKTSVFYIVIITLSIFLFGNFNAGTDFIYMQF